LYWVERGVDADEADLGGEADGAAGERRRSAASLSLAPAQPLVTASSESVLMVP
ncbi:MAG: hypothetical protein QOG77_3205, partial [Solirubrobacteraceae bacterium]|nr:hypothetical protein [Solirubrobacteraceae bacterium]